MEEVPAHVHPEPIVSDCRRFGRNLFQCYSMAPRRLVEIIDRTELGGGVHDRLGGLSLSIDLGVVAYTHIEASVDYEDSSRPSCSSWPAYTHFGGVQGPFIWLPYYDRPLVSSDLWRAEVPLICYEIMEYHYPGRVMRQFARA
ncbi:hypothetical protein M9H77_21752 [Catharanthus roseus]|uniref:Uncharacterized protein n=1 Tax=Catharanthus roseus TaxID=4058 RepID=A0ACC0AQJ3_CATRO|nr:hypothetical protein M9H77_21752 [Catharanthus roseus]